MKTNFFLVIFAALLVAAASCKSKQKDAQSHTIKENSAANTDDKQKANAGSLNIPRDIKKYIGRMDIG